MIPKNGKVASLTESRGICRWRKYSQVVLLGFRSIVPYQDKKIDMRDSCCERDCDVSILSAQDRHTMLGTWRMSTLCLKSLRCFGRHGVGGGNSMCLDLDGFDDGPRTFGVV